MKNTSEMISDSVPIAWTDDLKYLGMTFNSGKRLNVDISPVMRKFYAAAIMQYSHVPNMSQNSPN